MRHSVQLIASADFGYSRGLLETCAGAWGFEPAAGRSSRSRKDGPHAPLRLHSAESPRATPSKTKDRHARSGAVFAFPGSAGLPAWIRQRLQKLSETGQRKPDSERYPDPCATCPASRGGRGRQTPLRAATHDACARPVGQQPTHRQFTAHGRGAATASYGVRRALPALEADGACVHA